MPKETILVVEDNKYNMLLVSDLLKFAGYQVLQAETGEEAIEIAKTQSPDLILMDIGLPRMDGLAATRILKEDPATRKIPVVAVTAHAMKGECEKALESGCIGYVSKPLKVDEFAQMIADFISKNPLDD